MHPSDGLGPISHSFSFPIRQRICRSRFAFENLIYAFKSLHYTTTHIVRPTRCYCWCTGEMILHNFCRVLFESIYIKWDAFIFCRCGHTLTLSNQDEFQKKKPLHITGWQLRRIHNLPDGEICKWCSRSNGTLLNRMTHDKLMQTQIHFNTVIARIQPQAYYNFIYLLSDSLWRRFTESISEVKEMPKMDECHLKATHSKKRPFIQSH